MHGVFFPALGNRRVAVLTGLIVLGAITACGPDLGKADFQRTTVPAQPGGDGQVPTGPITDPAVSLAALRVVAPCPLVDKAALTDLGTPGDPSSFDLARCSNQVKDAGGKTIRVSVELGAGLGVSASKVNGVVEGLPLIEDKQDSSTCDVTALTSRSPDLGIMVNVTYPGGDPCKSGTAVLQKVVKRLHGSPPKYDVANGSLLTVDPCASLDDSAAREAAPAAKKTATGLHSCSWNGSGPSLLLDLRRGATPIAGDGYQKVDLGGGVSGFQKITTADTSECTVKWQHRPLGNDTAETVILDYTYYSGDPAKDDPCGKAVKLAKNILTKLPKP